MPQKQFIAKQLIDKKSEERHWKTVKVDGYRAYRTKSEIKEIYAIWLLNVNADIDYD